jgi:CO dehydrogenase/acetyl-CoA synthase gamma subunit (corrinoid Fe-S protein)
MTLEADLYLDRIDPLQYYTRSECRACGCETCGEWLEKLKMRRLLPSDCRVLGPNRLYALSIFLSLDETLPQVHITQHPVQGLLGLQEINKPGPQSPLLVTGNAMTTQEVLLAVLSTTGSGFYLLFVDCLGHTIDMAMTYGTFTAEKLGKALTDSELEARVGHREMILPGFTGPLRESFESETGWRIKIGPICAGEIPLYLADYWNPPASAAYTTPNHR